MTIEEKIEERKRGNAGRNGNAVMHIRLAPGEKRGWWLDNELPKGEQTQAFVRGVIEDLTLPLMLDSGANISLLHSNLARKLGLKVRMFGESSEFYGIGRTP